MGKPSRKLSDDEFEKEVHDWLNKPSVRLKRIRNWLMHPIHNRRVFGK